MFGVVVTVSAETLRKASALMRERAEAARIGPWLADAEAEMWRNPIVCGPEYPAEEEGHTHRFVIAECHGFSKPQNAEHIASWYPAVALAVADWLDAEATSMDSLALFSHVAEEIVEFDMRGAAITVSKGDDGSISMRADTSAPALAVANAYLGADL